LEQLLPILKVGNQLNRPRSAGSGSDESLRQGCQMVSFQTKNPNLGKLWRALDWKMLIYFMSIANILQTFEIFYDHLVHFVFIWYIFPVWVSCTKKNLATPVCGNLIFQPFRAGRPFGSDFRRSAGFSLTRRSDKPCNRRLG
jgi:hypothetical protein